MEKQDLIEAKKFDRIDMGWISMSIGMAIGAGIVFLPVQAGVLGLWVFLLSSVVGYPAMYLFQRLFIHTLVEAQVCEDYSGVISRYLGKNWGFLLGVLYFVMLIIWAFIYVLAITNDSASYLQSFGLTTNLWSENAWYALLLIVSLVSVASSQERFLLAISGSMAILVLAVVAVMGFLLVPYWKIEHIGTVDHSVQLIQSAISTLPFTLTSILFLQSLSPMVISYRARYKSIDLARYKATRAMNIAFMILFVVVFFFAVSFTLAISQEQAMDAKMQNISALAIIAQYYPGSWINYIGIVINIFAVVTSFFGVFLATREAVGGVLNNVLSRCDRRLSAQAISRLATGALILLFWAVALSNLPILKLAGLSGPIFGLVGCLIPAYLVYKVDILQKYRGRSIYFIIFTGLLLCVSPFF
tara:strand:- start:509 stop:1753 length:1245 start_codon:yes stop_codon:yes gene_type:complete